MKKARPHPRAPRGLDRAAILDDAFALLAQEGEAGFSIRKLAAAIGVDPMTVLHHFGSKEELLRQIADRALGSIKVPQATGSWQGDLRAVAGAYRTLAHRYPRLFHLHFRFHATGPADHASSELVYRAMLEAGLPRVEAAGLGLAFYAFVLGFAQAEIGGLLRPLDGAEEAEIAALDASAFPATRALLPAFRTLKSDAAFRSAMTAFIEGVEQSAGKPRRREGTPRSGSQVLSSKT